MKTIYECEICKHQYSNLEDAQKCENQGIPNADNFPLNVIFQHAGDSMYDKITFATAEFNVFGSNKHLFTVSLWACRNFRTQSSNSDSLGDETCGNGGLYRENQYYGDHMTVHNFEAPHFKRMVQYFIDNNIPVRYWDGEKVVDYDITNFKYDPKVEIPEYLKSKEEVEEEIVNITPMTATIPEDKWYDCRYAMYLHHRGVKSSVNGKDIIDAIKKSNRNAILVYVVDENGKEYIIKEHEEPVRDSFGYYWVEKDNESIVLYDEYYDPDSDLYLDKEVEEPIYSEPISTEALSVKSEDMMESVYERYEQQAEFGQNRDNLPLEIPDTYGIGLEFKDGEGIEYTTIGDLNKQSRRDVTLTISSFRGISPGAVHYYGRLSTSGLSFKNKEGERLNISGSFDKYKPKECLHFTIDLVRILTKEELEKWPDRFVGYRPGYTTNCFNTKQEVMDKGKEVFLKRFKGNWELEIDDCC